MKTIAVMVALVSTIAASACGSSSNRPAPGGGDEGLLTGEERGWRAAESGVAGPGQPADPASRPCGNFVRPGVLRRSAVVRAVDGGLGQWLSQVRVAAVRSGGRFQGWQIVQLYPGDPCYGAVDLRPGDLVTKVNGDTLERPEQANGIFQRLRTARSLEVELVRDGSPRRVSLAIAD